MIFVIIVIYLAFFGLLIASYWSIFTKAGRPGWACLVPVYNILLLADVARVDRKYAWYTLVFYGLGFITNTIISVTKYSELELYSLLSLILMLVGVVYLFQIWKGLSISFGKKESFAWGLLFLNFIFIAILGLGNARYQERLAFIDDDVLDSEM